MDGWGVALDYNRKYINKFKIMHRVLISMSPLPSCQMLEHRFNHDGIYTGEFLCR